MKYFSEYITKIAKTKPDLLKASLFFPTSYVMPPVDGLLYVKSQP